MSFKIQVADALKHATKTKNTALTMQRNFFKPTYRRWRTSETGKKKKNHGSYLTHPVQPLLPFFVLQLFFGNFYFLKH